MFFFSNLCIPLKARRAPPKSNLGISDLTHDPWSNVYFHTNSIYKEPSLKTASLKHHLSVFLFLFFFQRNICATNPASLCKASESMYLQASNQQHPTTPSQSQDSLTSTLLVGFIACRFKEFCYKNRRWTVLVRTSESCLQQHLSMQNYILVSLDVFSVSYGMMYVHT